MLLVALVYFWFFFILWFKLDYIQLYKGESINEAGRHRRLNTIEIVDLNTLNLEISKTSYADVEFIVIIQKSESDIFHTHFVKKT